MEPGFNSFINHFSEQFYKTDSHLFTEDTIYSDFDEWSSIVALSIVAMIYDEYKVSLTSNDIKENRTIGDLYKCVCVKWSTINCK